MLPIEALQERINNSELGQKWINDSLMNQDIWLLTELGYSEEKCRIYGSQNLYFDKFSLFWLKLLTKLTVKAEVLERHSLTAVTRRVNCLRNLDKFLIAHGYTQPQALTNSLLQKFIAESNSHNRQNTIAYVVRLWAEEQWLMISFIPQKYKKTTPKIEIIPEEVLYQVYEKFDLFPPPLERLFRLQLVLGCRIGEMLTMPRYCLKQESDQWFLLRWVQKRQHWQFYRIDFLVVELIQEQQKFLEAQFGQNSSFDKLFCQANTAKKFKSKSIYIPRVITLSTIRGWLQAFSKKADLRDKYGQSFTFTSHMLRRTKASIMAYCEAEDEYIAAVLGHGSLDMLSHYRQRSLDRLEKEATAKGYVDMYGRVSTFKPRKQRYQKLVELLKVSTVLGECHRPTMLGDCQYRYACLSCIHHRVTIEDQPGLETEQFFLQQDLDQALLVGQERRATEIKRLLSLVKNRLLGLEEIQNIKGEKADE